MSLFLNLFMFVLGLGFGLAIKVAFDYYNTFIVEQQKMSSRMEDILVNFKALEKIKEL